MTGEGAWGGRLSRRRRLPPLAATTERPRLRGIAPLHSPQQNFRTRIQLSCSL